MKKKLEELLPGDVLITDKPLFPCFVLIVSVRLVGTTRHVITTKENRINSFTITEREAKRSTRVYEVL
jgi:hypothetical protein